MEVARNVARANGRQERAPSTSNAKADGVNALVSLSCARGTNGTGPIYGIRDNASCGKARGPQGSRNRNQRAVLRSSRETSITRNAILNEDLTKALHSMMFAVGSLQDALKRTNAVEALVLLQQIEAAMHLKRSIEALLAAKESI